MRHSDLACGLGCQFLLHVEHFIVAPTSAFGVGGAVDTTTAHVGVLCPSFFFFFYLTCRRAYSSIHIPEIKWRKQDLTSLSLTGENYSIGIASII